MLMNKINAVNVWRAAQGLPPIVTSGKTAKAKANGASKQAQSNAAARAQANRDMKANRQSKGRGK